MMFDCVDPWKIIFILKMRLVHTLSYVVQKAKPSVCFHNVLVSFELLLSFVAVNVFDHHIFFQYFQIVSWHLSLAWREVPVWSWPCDCKWSWKVYPPFRRRTAAEAMVLNPPEPVKEKEKQGFFRAIKKKKKKTQIVRWFKRTYGFFWLDVVFFYL